MKERILLVGESTFEKGGLQTVIMSIVRCLHTYYTFDLLLFTDQKGYYDDEFISYGGTIFQFPKSSNKTIRKISNYFNYILYYYKTKRLIKENGNYKAIHCHNGIDALPFIMAAKIMAIPIRIVHSHVVYKNNHAFFTRKIIDKLLRLGLKRNSTAFIGCSDIACVSMFGNKIRSQIVPNSYNEKLFNQKLYARALFTAPILIQIGSFSDLKNQLYTLRIFSEVLKTYPDSKLHFVGFDLDNYKYRIENYINENGLEESVILHPCDADTPYLLSQSSHYIQPSRSESFAIVLLEAQAMGLRCLVSDVVPTISNCGGCEYLSIDVEPSIWATFIIDDFKKTKGKAHQWDCSNFTQNNISELYHKLYTS